MRRQLLFDRPIPEGWRVLFVDEVKAPEKHSCVAGPFGSSISSKYFVNEGVPVIRGSNLRDDLTPFVPEGFAFVSPEQAARYKAQHVRPGDLVFTCWGTLGQVGLIPADGPYCEYIISNKQLKLRPDPDIADARFLFYYFGSPQMVSHIRSIAIGAAVPGISLGLLKGIQITLPPLSIQRRIASILSAYDDLIENSTRRIKILEEMAQMLYREWFVNFRFPGHQKVKMVESALGPIPKGWSVPPLEEMLQHAIGGGWGEEEERPEFIVPAYVIRGTDIPGARHGLIANCPLRWHKESNFTSRKIEAGDLVFEVSGGSKGQPVGRSLLVGQTLLSQWAGDVICASFCKLLRPKAEMRLAPALYCFLLEAYTNGLIEKYQVQSTGISNFKFTAFLNEVRMPLPPRALMDRFTDILDPMLEAVAILGKRNANLRATRDLLLPKLISGEIPVSAAEKALEQSA